ncbi:amidohydrolase family protein [Mesorhizobium sp. WSM4887]|uniref:amidohydrolase family protein n=1 Tax=Mesorhizobium sp. WSM4887 TaxID=3038543 RepID=UPI002417D8D2|nr:amidohydrolase family protein [Mesorhizobium sp. WSM4887]MDG4889752.1 amidohydrolase family protein [Mesorhizobium sp. WSM4887]
MSPSKKIVLIRGRQVFSHPTTRHDWHVVENGGLLVAGDTILDVGEFQGLREANPGATVIGDGSHVILPGFVNSHHHIGLTTIQLGVPDLPLELWLNARLKQRPVDPYLDTLYSAFEMIGSGVTTVQHLRGGQFGNAQAVNDTADAIIKAYEDVGMRVSLGMGVRDQNRLHQQMDDETFVATLPAEMRERVGRQLQRFPLSLDDFFDVYADMSRRYSGRPLVRTQLAPPNLHWMSDASLARFAEASAKSGDLMHLHLDETQYQKEYARRRGGGSAIDYIAGFDLLSPRLTLGHGVWLNENDVDRIANHNVHICHNCSSNFRLRSGIAPLNYFEKKGVEVAIGIDEAGINDDRDMLQEMRMVLNAHRVPGVEDGVPTAGQVLRMATRCGALTTPFGDRIGHLVPGALADLSMIEWSSVAKPYLDPDTPVLAAVLHRAKPSSVARVIIGGEIVYEEGHFSRIDREAIMERIEEVMSRPRTPLEDEARQTAKEIVRHIRASYGGYVGKEHRPYYTYNSKK